jgi:hypothetical protein
MKGALSWLDANKAWLFDGGGVVVVVGVVGWIWRIVQSRRRGSDDTDVLLAPEPSQGQTNSDALQVTDAPSSVSDQASAFVPQGPLHPDDLERELESLPLLQRRAFLESCRGMPVAFDATLFAVTSLAEDRARIQVRIGVFRTDWLFEVDPRAYPELPIMHRDTPVRVQGRFKELQFGFILSEATLTFGKSEGR